VWGIELGHRSKIISQDWIFSYLKWGLVISIVLKFAFKPGIKAVEHQKSKKEVSRRCKLNEITFEDEEDIRNA